VSKALLALLCTPLLMGGACEKKSAKDPGAIAAMDRAGSGAKVQEGSGDNGPVDTTPLAGVDVSKLSDDHKQLFYKLVGSLNSPCGKAHNLRTSFTSDTSCKRAPFAVKYVMAMVDDELQESLVREAYDAKYTQNAKTAKFDLSKAPHIGNDDAAVRLVEFFDYGCPHCAAFKPMMEKVLEDRGSKIVEYFMMFPLEKHTDSKSAAQAALAAAQQGKFKPMHDLLFDNAPQHDHEHVTDYAKKIGLDMGKFEADYAAQAGHVDSDVKQGETAGVDSTPTLFFNDRKYEGPMHPKYIEMWIDEELAVNR